MVIRSGIPALVAGVMLFAPACASGDVTVDDGSAATVTTFGTMPATSTSPPGTMIETSTSTHGDGDGDGDDRFISLSRIAHLDALAGDVWMTSVDGVGDLVVAGGAAAIGFYTQAVVWSSTDSGNSWSRTDVSGASDREENELVTAVVAGSNRVVALGVRGKVGGYRLVGWQSADGLEWTEDVTISAADGAGDHVAHAAVDTPDRLVAVGEAAGRPQAWYSADGSSWDSASVDQRDGVDRGAMLDVAAGGPGLVAVGFGGDPPQPEVWLSADGRAWSPVMHPTDAAPGVLTCIGVAPEGLVAAGYDLADRSDPTRPEAEAAAVSVWTSELGFDWIRLDADFDAAATASSPFSYLKRTGAIVLNDMGYWHDRLVAVGGYVLAPTATLTPGFVTVWVSSDGGFSWTAAGEAVLEHEHSTVLAASPIPAVRYVSMAPTADGMVVVGHDALPTGHDDQWGFEIFATTAAVWHITAD